jgi:DNA-binding protein HU-beta
MTKKDMINLVARKAHLTKKAAEEAVDVFLNEIGRVLSKGEKVVLSGFGTFRVISMKGKFTPGKRLKRQVTR